MKPWQLIDAEKRHRECPALFLVPGEVATRNVKVGDLVKIGFENPAAFLWSGVPNGERFWVKVERAEHPMFEGCVMNDLLLTRFHGKQGGSKVQFWANNLLSVTPPGPGERPPRRFRFP